MRRKVVGARPSSSRGNTRESPNHTLRLTEKERKIATPPKRGSGAWWISRPLCGAETQPLRVAVSRTSRVATNETASENANNPKNRSVNQSSLPAVTSGIERRVLSGSFSRFIRLGLAFRGTGTSDFWFLKLYNPPLSSSNCPDAFSGSFPGLMLITLGR